MQVYVQCDTGVKDKIKCRSGVRSQIKINLQIKRDMNNEKKKHPVHYILL